MDLEKSKALLGVIERTQEAYPEGHPAHGLGMKAVSGALDKLRQDEDFGMVINQLTNYAFAAHDEELDPLREAAKLGVIDQKELNNIRARMALDSLGDLENPEDEKTAIYLRIFGKEIRELVTKNITDLGEKETSESSLVETVSDEPEVTPEIEQVKELDRASLLNLFTSVATRKLGANTETESKLKELSAEQLQKLWGDLKDTVRDVEQQKKVGRKWANMERDLRLVETYFSSQPSLTQAESAKAAAKREGISQDAAAMAVRKTVIDKLHLAFRLSAREDPAPPNVPSSKPANVRSSKPNHIQSLKNRLEQLNQGSTDLRQLVTTYVQLASGLTTVHKEKLLEFLELGESDELDVTRELEDAAEGLWAQLMLKNNLDEDEAEILKRLFNDCTPPTVVAEELTTGSLAWSHEEIVEFAKQHILELVNTLGEPLVRPETKKKD